MEVAWQAFLRSVGEMKTTGHESDKAGAMLLRDIY